MKNKDIKSARTESEESLQKKITLLRQEIGKLLLERKTNPPKDSNTIGKKRKQLSITLTILKEKEHGKTA